MLRLASMSYLRPGLFFPVALFALGLAGCQKPRVEPPHDYAITDFGAVAGGAALNTTAIQSAIDTATAKGGGTVVIPAGVFRSGAIFLKPGVELRLADGAVLKGSENIEDYPKQRTRIEGHFEPWRVALVNASGLARVRITGAGRLDGSGPVYWNAFWQRRKENPKCTNLEVERPRLVFIDRCTDVRIEGVALQDSGFWNLHLYRCRDVVVEGVRITIPSATGGLRGPSTDGIDLDSSQDVTIRTSATSRPATTTSRSRAARARAPTRMPTARRWRTSSSRIARSATATASSPAAAR